MKRFRNEKGLMGILIVFAICFINPQTSSAHPPTGVRLSYDSISQRLTVTITHPSITKTWPSGITKHQRKAAGRSNDGG